MCFDLLHRKSGIVNPTIISGQFFDGSFRRLDDTAYRKGMNGNFEEDPEHITAPR